MHYWWNKNKGVDQLPFTEMRLCFSISFQKKIVPLKCYRSVLNCHLTFQCSFLEYIMIRRPYIADPIAPHFFIVKNWGYRVYIFSPYFCSRHRSLILVRTGLVIFMSRDVRKPDFACAKTKTQISFEVTAKLISAFVFATRIVQYLSFLNTKFKAASHFLRLHSLICVGPGRKPRKPVFSRRGSYDSWACYHYVRWCNPCSKQCEPRREKTGLRGFRPGPTQTGLYNDRR